MQQQTNEPISLYFHIPFCLQRCYYCDFATYQEGEIPLTHERYVQAIVTEISRCGELTRGGTVATIYFGGGTPSLLKIDQFMMIFAALKEAGYCWQPSVTEITLEINPATIKKEDLRELMSLGFNRFSVGAQTFNPQLLSHLNRKHSVEDTRHTLALLAEHGVNYSLDLLYALPHQTLRDLEQDLEEIQCFRPPHVSAYCLTLKQNHFLNRNRPSEEVELAMMRLVEECLHGCGYQAYEISNFSIHPQYQSQHNLAYWNDRSYLGFGLSSHSYLKWEGSYGVRFANPSSWKEYLDWVEGWHPQRSPAEGRFFCEYLDLHESVTDFCHISLRKREGLSLAECTNKFGPVVTEQVRHRLEICRQRRWLELVEPTLGDNRLRLSRVGRELSNQVFLLLTFSKGDLPLTFL
ncbi:MAG: radical SAM family heme chaperone HemW [Bdellovibrionaceae bacterium]|nr:radical SAM family heme chaperone HemW [Pseudobdellovibrionaceae bacterium]MDW8190994.1 radical SAM family heme chaperone HemW [Pseudobdellovibrionaceae bacterium]